MDANRRMGTVKWFSRIKGYGFIAPDDQEKEIFVHYSGIEGEGYRNLEKGQRVSFVVEDTTKGPQAVAVRAQAREEAGAERPAEKVWEPSREYEDLDEDSDEEPEDLIA